MMGRQPKVQKSLFYTKFNLDRRIRKDHILRKIDKRINFEFIYDQVKDTYGSKGNVSVPPPVILKMMLLLILCRLREQCTRSSLGRSLKRHLRQDDLDIMLEQAQSPAAKRDIKSRQHLMERSFARASRYGLKRARWRRLWRVQIQEYLTASIQNLMVLLRYIKDPSAALSHRMDRPCVDNRFINFKAASLYNLRGAVYRSRRVIY